MNIIDKVAAAVVPGGGSSDAASLDPMNVLVDLRPPANILEILTPILQSLGLSWEEITLEDNVAGMGDQRKIHRCRLNGTLEFFLAHIPNWILERNSGADRAAVDFLRHSFSEGGRVYIVSEGINNFKIAFSGTFLAWKQQSKINALLIPWSTLQELKERIAASPAITSNQRAHYLRLVFSLDELGTAKGSASPATLTDPEKKQFAAILAKQASDFALGSKGYFTDLLKNTNLPKPWEEARIAALSGISGSDANDLAEWATTIGTNTKEGRQAYTVLAEFIEHMMGGVGLEDQKTLKKWALNKPLILTQPARDAFHAKFPQV